MYNRYLNLPGSGFFEKLMYVSHKILSRQLVSRGVLDVNGCRCKPMRTFCPWNSSARSDLRLVCLTGFGHSGSGAIADLLSEYDGVETRSHVDQDGSLKRKNSVSEDEFDLLTAADGGLFALEGAFSSKNEAVRDAAMKAFLRLVAYLHVEIGGIYNHEFLGLARQFVDKLVLSKSARVTQSGYTYCPHLSVMGSLGARLVLGEKNDSSIFWLKNLTIAEYQSAASQFLSDFLSRIANERCLVLDQAVSDGSCDLEKYEAYLGPLKLIAVYRDPRDVYATAVKLGVKWMPTDPENFIFWYRNRLERYVNRVHPDFLLLRFEDAIRNYADTVKSVEGFVGLDSAAHVRAFSCFDPARSAKNVGIYKTVGREPEMAMIGTALSDYCFDE